MVYLCINLPAYRQLSKLGKEALQEALKAVENFIDVSACEAVFDDDCTWICATPMEGGKAELERRKKDFAAAVLDLKRKMDEYERQLQGYSLFIDAGEDRLARSLFATLKSRMVESTGEGELLITGDALTLLEGAFKTAPVEGETFRILDIGSEGETVELRTAGFLVRDGLLLDFKRTYEAMWLSEDDKRTMVILTESGNGGCDTVRYAFDQMFSGTDAFRITIRSADVRFGDAYPVARSVWATLDHCNVVEYLNTSERELWTRRTQGFLGEPGSGRFRITGDRPDIDLFQIITLQLTAYERCMEGQLLPPTWLCESYEQLTPAVKDACLRAVTNRRSGKLMAIFLVHGEAVPEELLAVPHTVFRIPEIEKVEIVRKLSSSSTDVAEGEAGELAERFLESGGGSLKRLYHLYSLSKQGEISKKAASEPLCALLSTCDLETRKALFLLTEGELALPEKQAAVFLNQCDLGRESIHSARMAVQELKLDIGGDPAEGSMVLGCLEKGLGSAAEPLRRELINYLSRASFEERAAVSLQAIEVLAAAEDHGLCAEVVAERVEAFLDSDSPAAAAEVLGKVAPLRKERPAAVTLQLLKLKTSTLTGDSAQAAKNLAELRKLPDTGSEVIEGRRYLEYARYHYAAGLFQEGLQDSKNALISFQKYSIPQEKEAYLFIGLHMLAQSRVNEAEAYLRIARESTAKEDTMLFVLNGVYSAVTQFMIGNLTRALSAVMEAKTIAEESAFHRYHVYLIFLEVRIQFELGRYERCTELCLDGLTLCRLYGSRPRAVFEKWLRRAQAFSGFPNDAAESLMRIATDREARFFLAEAFYLDGRPEKALHSLETEESGFTSKPGPMRPAEQMMWETGFSNLEDRVIVGPEGRGVLSMLIQAFYAYLQSTLDKEDTGLNTLARIAKEEKLSNIDPYNGIYYYFHACALEPTAGDRSLDRLTALSKAFKYVQERAAVMDDAHDKQSYLHNNYFNSQILKEARESNLM